MILWVNMQLYGWATKKWASRDVRIDPYLGPRVLKITRHGYTAAPKGRIRYIKLKREAIK